MIMTPLLNALPDIASPFCKGTHSPEDEKEVSSPKNLKVGPGQPRASENSPSSSVRSGSKRLQTGAKSDVTPSSCGAWGPRKTLRRFSL